MIGVPMPPTPDEPDPRRVRRQRPEERQPWDDRGLRLGEASERAEYAAAIQTAVALMRMIQRAR